MYIITFIFLKIGQESSDVKDEINQIYHKQLCCMKTGYLIWFQVRVTINSIFSSILVSCCITQITVLYQSPSFGIATQKRMKSYKWSYWNVHLRGNVWSLCGTFLLTTVIIILWHTHQHNNYEPSRVYGPGSYCYSSNHSAWGRLRGQYG